MLTFLVEVLSKFHLPAPTQSNQRNKGRRQSFHPHLETLEDRVTPTIASWPNLVGDGHAMSSDDTPLAAAGSNDLRAPTLLRGPATITRPGTYKLVKDVIVRSGNAFNILADNVVLDLNGHKVIGPGSWARGYGIWSIGTRRVTVRNGTISGFLYGVYFSGSYQWILSRNLSFTAGNHVVERMRLIGNTFRGLRIEGMGNVVRDNIIQDTGGTRRYRNPIVMGLETIGPGALIENNRVYGIRGNGHGIAVTALSSGAVIRENLVSNSAIETQQHYTTRDDGLLANARTRGIWIGGLRTKVTVAENQVINFSSGIAFESGAEGLLTRNIVASAEVPYYFAGRGVVFGDDNVSDDGDGLQRGDWSEARVGGALAPAPRQQMRASPRSIYYINKPSIITRPGYYKLRRDIIVTRGIGIDIRASDVVIDLNGFSIIGPRSARTKSIGIWAMNENNITILNGSIQRFMYGIYLSDDHGTVLKNDGSFNQGNHLIDNVKLVGQSFRGIRIEGRGNVVRNSFLQDIGGSSVHAVTIAAAIESIGPGALIENNQIFELRGHGIGIFLYDRAGGAIVTGNKISTSSTTGNIIWNGRSWGIRIMGESSTTLVTGNYLMNLSYGITMGAGIEGLLSGNIVSTAKVPYLIPESSDAESIFAADNQSDSATGLHRIDPLPDLGRIRSTVAPVWVAGSSLVTTISTPRIIATPGRYRLSNDIVVSGGKGLNIQADDVEIDLNGYSIVGPGFDRTNSIGVYAVNQSRIKIHNGTIRGFFYGIYLSDNYGAVRAGKTHLNDGGHVIEHLNLADNTFRGLRVEGRGNVVRDNVIRDTGGSRRFPVAYAAGIESYGPGALIEHNHIYAIRGQGAGIMIGDRGAGSFVHDNTIANSSPFAESNYSPTTDGTGTLANTRGIIIGNVLSRVMTLENRIINFTYGINYHANARGFLDENVVTQARMPYLFSAGRPLTLPGFSDSNSSDQKLTGLYYADTLKTAVARVPIISTGLQSRSGSPRSITGPLTITQPGKYILMNNLTAAGDEKLITIESDDVEIDLNGHTISGPGTQSTMSVGIFASDRRRIHIHNGIIKGFMYGIRIVDDYEQISSSGGSFDKGGHVLEDLRLTENTFRGMRVEGRGNVIRDNIVERIGGTIVHSNAYAFGIESLGPGALIENNYIYSVHGMTSKGEGVGISVSYIGGGSIIRDNTIANSGRRQSQYFWDWPADSASTWGVWVGGTTTRVVVADNLVTNFKFGLTIHAWADGIMANNISSEARVPFYTPGRPTPRAFFVDNHSCDTDPCNYRIEKKYK